VHEGKNEALSFSDHHLALSPVPIVLVLLAGLIGISLAALIQKKKERKTSPTR